MTEPYYILEDGEQTGPYTFDELIDIGVDIHTRVLSPNADGWQDACDLPEFFEYFESLGVYFPTEDNLASFWWRLLAFIIDYVILSFVWQIILSILTAKGVVPQLTTLKDYLNLYVKHPVFTQLLINGTFILYYTIGEASPLKGSFGKRICKLVVVDADGMGLTFPYAVFRSFGKAASVFYFYGLGCISIFWTEHRQALHDLMAKTYVIRRD